MDAGDVRRIDVGMKGAICRGCLAVLCGKGCGSRGSDSIQGHGSAIAGSNTVQTHVPRPAVEWCSGSSLGRNGIRSMTGR